MLGVIQMITKQMVIDIMSNMTDEKLFKKYSLDKDSLFDVLCSDEFIKCKRDIEANEKILREQELQMTGLTSARDAVAIGEVLNVQYMVFGSLSKVGSEYYINVKVVNISTAEVEVSGEEIAGSKATLRLAARKLAMKLDPAQ